MSKVMPRLLKEIEDREIAVPSLPNVAGRIIELTADEDISINKIVEIIEKSQSIVVKLLKIANSTFYRGAKEIKTIQGAVTRVGLDVVKSAILNISLLDVFKGGKDSSKMQRKVWQESFTMAVSARSLAKRTNHRNPEEAFTVGLVSHIGIMIILNVVGEDYLELLGEKFYGGKDLNILEGTEYQTDHVEVGYLVLSRWNFPEIIKEAVRHHDSQQMLPSSDERSVEIVKIIQAAEKIAAFFVTENPTLNRDIIRLCKLFFDMNEEEVEEFLQHIEQEVNEAASLLGIDRVLDKSCEQIYRSAVGRLADLNLKYDELNKTLRKSEEERKRAEEAVRESEKRIRSVLETSPIGISIYDRDGQCIGANQSMAKIIGATKEQVLQQNYNNIESWKKSGLYAKAKSAIGKNSTERHELKVESTFGETVRLDCYLTSFSSGGLLFMANDISKRMQTEEALRESEENYRDLYENAPNAYFSVSAVDGSILRCNTATFRLLGYDRETILGMKALDLYANTPDGLSKAQEVFKRFRAGESIKDIELQMKHKHGHPIRISLSVEPLRDRDGNITESRSMAIDISERKSLEAQLAQAQKVEALGTLAGGIAHNFNNLLMGIVGNTSLMLLETDSSHPSYERLKTIQKSVKSGSKLTAQLLGYAREGRYEVKTISLNLLVKEVSDTFGMTKKDIKVHQHLTENLLAIKADQGQIEQILLNLYVNASDALPGGGDLFLRTANVTYEDMKGKPYKAKPGNYVLLTVRDTGVGMDRKTLERIFDPFFTTKGLARGTGLGLASVYGTVKAHGGYIDVESNKGHGTTFSIYLPASSEKVALKEKQLPEKILKGKETILLVDDEDIVLDVGNEMLDALGYSVLLAKSGKEAIEIVSKAHRAKSKEQEGKERHAPSAMPPAPDMVLLDMVMPEMGGGETYDRMKEISPDIKVLLSSGYSIDGQATEIIKRGCDGFIQKPFDMQGLSQRIRKILDKK
jgi:PAS domain S-box-containing protein